MAMAGLVVGIILGALGLHHGEADPTLLQWIMAALSHILVGTLGFSELTIVIVIGIIILAIPGGIVLLYWASTRGAVTSGQAPQSRGVEPAVAPEGEE
jgi:hypothetical protein